MDAAKASKRKRSHDRDGDDGNTQEHEEPSQKHTCRVVKDEPNDDNIISLQSLPAHPVDGVSPKREEDEEEEREKEKEKIEVSEAGRETLPTPPPTQPEAPASPPPPPSPPPRYWHPAFPDQAVRCRGCQKTDTVSRVPAARSNPFNAGRFQFTCTGCGMANRFKGFICWADARGIYEDNTDCDCGLKSRADLTTRAGPPGRIFFTCGLGKCRFHLTTNHFVTDKADLEHEVNIWVSKNERITLRLISIYNALPTDC